MPFSNNFHLLWDDRCHSENTAIINLSEFFIIVTKCYSLCLNFYDTWMISWFSAESVNSKDRGTRISNWFSSILIAVYVIAGPPKTSFCWWIPPVNLPASRNNSVGCSKFYCRTIFHTKFYSPRGNGKRFIIELTHGNILHVFLHCSVFNLEFRERSGVVYLR